MKSYKNIMEILVENKWADMSVSLDCCTCDRCKNDILAFALNHLPAKYVVTQEGEVYSKTYVLEIQHNADILTALTQGAELVKKYPRHTPIKP